MTAPSQPSPLTARHATLEDLAALLRDQQAREVDVVAPPSALRARGGMLTVAGTEPVLTADGVDMADGTYRPTAVCDEGIAEKLGIPVAYLRKLREQAIELYDANAARAGRGWRGRCCRTGTSGSIT